MYKTSPCYKASIINREKSLPLREAKGRRPKEDCKTRGKTSGDRSIDSLEYLTNSTSTRSMGKPLSRVGSGSRGNSPTIQRKDSSSNSASSTTLPQVEHRSHTLKSSAIDSYPKGYQSSHPTTALLNNSRLNIRRNSADSGYNSSGKVVDNSTCISSSISNIAGGGRRNLQQRSSSNDKNEKRENSGVDGLIDLDEQNRNKPCRSTTRTFPSKGNSETFCRGSQGRDSSLSTKLGRASLDNNSKTNFHSSERSMISRSPKDSSDGLVGLQNLGNTCFMNSILQCLSHCKPLRDKLIGNDSLQHNGQSKMKGKLVSTFADLIKAMWSSRNRPEVALSPHSFKVQIQRFSPRFVGYEQQDCQEFLRFLLDGLHEDLNYVTWRRSSCLSPDEDRQSVKEKSEYKWKQYKSRDNSLITDLFCGQMKSTLTCTKCDYESVTFDPFWDLSLSIPRTVYSSYSTSSSNSVTLVDCLKRFTKTEELDRDEKPKCEKCKVRQKCKKQFEIQKFPRILVLHLKRFSGFGFRSKLQTNVDFPLNHLDMSEFASIYSDSPHVKYSLFAVSNHSGSTYGGHYTAYCKHPESKEWHSFNDSRVGALSNSSVHGAQAYVLFYEMEDVPSSML